MLKARQGLRLDTGDVLDAKSIGLLPTRAQFADESTPLQRASVRHTEASSTRLGASVDVTDASQIARVVMSMTPLTMSAPAADGIVFQAMAGPAVAL
jgi:hypothetical protein